MLVTLTKMVENLKTYQKIFCNCRTRCKKNNPILKYKKQKNTQIIVKPKNIKNFLIKQILVLYREETLCLSPYYKRKSLRCKTL